MTKFKRLLCLTLSLILLFSFSIQTTAAEKSNEPNKISPYIKVSQRYGTVPHGSDSDYTVLISNDKHNSKLSSFASTLTVNAIAAGLTVFFGIPGSATQAAASIINAGLSLSDTVYIHKTVYGHKDDSWSYRKIVTKIYSDSSYTKLITSKTEYLYQYFY